MDFNHPAYFLCPYRPASFNLSHLLQPPPREFYGFSKVPNASKITCFKQDFLDDLQHVFDYPVDVTEPIYRSIDSAKADMTVFDTSGIETFVTENNPKYANRIIMQLKAYEKAHEW